MLTATPAWAATMRIVGLFDEEPGATIAFARADL